MQKLSPAQRRELKAAAAELEGKEKGVSRQVEEIGLKGLPDNLSKVKRSELARRVGVKQRDIPR